MAGTYPKRRKEERRRTVGRFTPEELRSIFDEFLRETAILWAAASRRTTLEQLAADDWFVVGLGDEIQSWFRQRYFPGPALIRLLVKPRDRLQRPRTFITAGHARSCSPAAPTGRNPKVGR